MRVGTAENCKDRDRSRHIQVAAEVYRDAAGVSQSPVMIEDLQLLRLPARPLVRLLAVDGHPYMRDRNALRRLALSEQATLEPRPSGDPILRPEEVVIDAEQRQVHLYPSSSVVSGPATLENMLLSPGSYYCRRYSVNLPAAGISPAAISGPR